MKYLTADVHRVTVAVRQSGPQATCLRRRAAMPEHEVGRGLLRGGEQDRAHEAVAALQVPQHLVATAYVRPAGGVDV